MVAPVTFEKSSRFLVRVPGPPHLPATAPTRHLSLQEEEKPEPAAPTPPASEGSPSQASPPTQARSPLPEVTTTTTMRCLPRRDGARRRWCSSSSSTSSTTSGSSTPFRSLRGKRGGGARPDSMAKRKAYELDPQEDPDMERCRQNAINAKRNREQKKARLAELEKRVEEGDRERDRLLEKNRELQEGMAELQREVKHLTNILRNQSRLSDILGKLASAGGSRSSRQVGGVHP
ncbi:transcription factor HY5-like [Portunus trituberculatus]|uniref:transcription factor HY5-like n=1 Tax=Portunus trituberculatus TaxID=210409 RepID=UPI001E1CC9C2|nr:transcription factor HY5-like [Portunus trituberculatus]